MPEKMSFLPGGTLIIIITSLAVVVFLAAYYFIRKSLVPTENFDNKMLKSLTHEEKQEALSYCISFFQDAYDAHELPNISLFMEIRLKAAIVFTFYKRVRKAAYVYMKLKNYYYKNKPLPDFTPEYIDKLMQDGRSGSDTVSAFCLYGIEEFSRLEK